MRVIAREWEGEGSKVQVQRTSNRYTAPAKPLEFSEKSIETPTTTLISPPICTRTFGFRVYDVRDQHLNNASNARRARYEYSFKEG